MLLQGLQGNELFCPVLSCQVKLQWNNFSTNGTPTAQILVEKSVTCNLGLSGTAFKFYVIKLF